MKSLRSSQNWSFRSGVSSSRSEGSKIWSRKSSSDPPAPGLSRAALHEASFQTLLRKALDTLVRSANVSRIGVWMETESFVSPDRLGPTTFQGLVWDDDPGAVPAEWSRLSPEAPLPKELITDLVVVEQELGSSRDLPMIGPLLGLQHVLWVPIDKKNHLRGVILLGTRKKQGALPRALAESVAAELELAWQFTEQRHQVLARAADMSLARQTLSSLGNPTSVFAILAELTEGCVLPVEKHGPGAAFAVIGSIVHSPGVSSETPELEFLWKSGNPEWTTAVESEPLAGIWRKAIASHRLFGADPGVSWSQGELARVVAIPLGSPAESLGVLVVGLPRSATSLTVLDRLEFRATLATLALERRALEQRHEIQHTWRHSLLEANSAPAFLLDSNSILLSMNSAARELLHSSKTSESSTRVGSLLHKPFVELFVPRSQPAIHSFCRHLFDGKLGSGHFPEAELANGEKIKFLAATPAAPGSAVVLLQSLQSQQDSAAAERAEVELHNVIEWLEEGVVLFDAQENVRAVNTRFEQMAGLSPQESGTFKTLDDWIARLELQAADPGAFAERWRELARGIEGGVREELQMSRPAPRVLERASRAIQDLAGRRLGRLEIYRDLTAQRVFQSKLLQTEKLAALGQMVTGVAHELSNPLTSILGYAQRLLLRGESSANFTGIRQIFQEAERATGILRQLLLSAREAPPERRPVAVNQIVQRAMEVQSYGLSSERIHIQLDLDPVLPYVLGDAGQLQQVLMNLVGNARQAIEQTGKPGTILLRTRRTGEKFVQLEVIDNGPGIPHGIQARIFDPFFTTKPAGVGTGLGLAIVLGIVREHGGRVQVSTSPEGGAAFSIELPAMAAAPSWKATELANSRLQGPTLVPSEPAASATPMPLTRLASGDPVRVLVVEDEPTVARLIADVLEEEGLRVDVLLDGREALDLARRETFDLVICDMKMPGIDGQHFYNTLARAGNPLAEHFLFVTGDIVAPTTHEFLARNHLPHVAKPFRVEELTEKVRRMLPNILRSAAPSAVVKRNVAGNG